MSSEHYPINASLMVQDTLARPFSGFSYLWIRNGMPEIASRKLLLLNWISFCLVHQSVGQTIAASLITHAGTKKATFLLSVNEPPSQSLLDYSTAFFSSLNTVFSRQVERMASGNHAFDDTDVHAIMDVVVTHAPERILRKLERLTTCVSKIGPDDVKFYLDRAFTLWEAHRGSSSSPLPAECTRQSVMDDYDSIVSLLHSDEQSISDAFHIAQSSAKRLIRSPFIAESAKLAADGALDPADRVFILKFHRRLWRFRFYFFGAERVLQGSTSDRMRQFCRAGWTFEHTWLPTPAELNVTIPVDRYSYVASILERKGYRATPELLDKWLAAFTKDDVWKAGVAKVCRVHPEMQLMQYLSHDDIAYTRNDPVGTSKRPCMMCHYCVEHGYKAAKTPFQLTSATQKVVTDWLSPILGGTGLGGPVDLAMKSYMTRLEDNVVRRFRSSRGETDLDRPNYDFTPST